MKSLWGSQTFFNYVRLPNLAGNLSKRTLSNTMPLNNRNSEIVHFCNDNDNDNDHRKKIDKRGIVRPKSWIQPIFEHLDLHEDLTDRNKWRVIREQKNVRLLI